MVTRYEVVADVADGRSLLVAYTPRLGRPGLLAAMRGVGPDLIAVAGITDDDLVTWGPKAGRLASATFGSKVSVRFSGRTQKDAAAAPLAFVKGAAK